MASSPLVRELIEALEPVAAQRGVDIVDVEVVGPAKTPTVRVRIDHADEEAPAITLDEVTVETGWISAAVDELDLFTGSFTLEVSSPGLSRPLRRPRDFERFAGSTVAVTTTATEGRRRFTGQLLGLSDGDVVIRTDEGDVAIGIDEIGKCTIKPDFGIPARPGKPR